MSGAKPQAGVQQRSRNWLSSVNNVPSYSLSVPNAVDGRAACQSPLPLSRTPTYVECPCNACKRYTMEGFYESFDDRLCMPGQSQLQPAILPSNGQTYHYPAQVPTGIPWGLYADGTAQDALYNPARYYTKNELYDDKRQPMVGTNQNFKEPKPEELLREQFLQRVWKRVDPMGIEPSTDPEPKSTKAQGSSSVPKEKYGSNGQKFEADGIGNQISQAGAFSERPTATPQQDSESTRGLGSDSKKGSPIRTQMRLGDIKRPRISRPRSVVLFNEQLSDKIAAQKEQNLSRPSQVRSVKAVLKERIRISKGVREETRAIEASREPATSLRRGEAEQASMAPHKTAATDGRGNAETEEIAAEDETDWIMLEGDGDGDTWELVQEPTPEPAVTTSGIGIWYDTLRKVTTLP